jgi:hypothetical protein
MRQEAANLTNHTQSENGLSVSEIHQAAAAARKAVG